MIKNFLTTSLVSLAVVVLPLITAAQSPEERGLEIATKADDKDTGWHDNTSDVKMVLKTKQGDTSNRILQVKVLENPKQGDLSLVDFSEPKDVKGTILLTHSHDVAEDEQWLFLPALKRVKRIAASNKSGPFVGSEYAYEDMIPQELPKYTYKYIKDEPCAGSLTCHMVERYPVDKNSGYTKQVVWLDNAEYRIHKIDYYDRKDSLLKTLTVSKYQQYSGKYWRPDTSEMVNHQTGKSTALLATNYKFQTGLSKEVFNPDKIGK